MVLKYILSVFFGFPCTVFAKWVAILCSECRTSPSYIYLLFFFFFLSHCWVLHPTPSPLPPSPLSPKKMSVSLTTDIQQEGESGPLIEPCSRGKTSPQPQGTKEGTGESLEPDDSSPQDAQVGEVDHTGDSKFAFRC